MLIRPERPEDIEAISAVIAAAFREAEHSAPPLEPGGDPGEVPLVAWLREDAGWIPELSLVAVDGDAVIGHVLATRAFVGEVPVLGLGPLSVLPARQSGGVGASLMNAVLGVAEEMSEPLVGLLGDPAYYGRFGFLPASAAGVEAPDPDWGDYFQIKTLSSYRGSRGLFRYAEPFSRL
ncbi:N-acetyltransferase [Nocardioides marmoriginsengisoli]|uniref:N-acetyltransferase n=1 Tax=Nocardioides marmoriginsengisoli TaxID=661483 RepID=A0A3N0CAM0_9ACTN|nr:N-acetyltransferase [Nocardioides marmoriginsengisoli]RNL60500.1 N-acetyltransferase [Nocardioides marmoriginsengisoli]